MQADVQFPTQNRFDLLRCDLFRHFENGIGMVRAEVLQCACHLFRKHSIAGHADAHSAATPGNIVAGDYAGVAELGKRLLHLGEQHAPERCQFHASGRAIEQFATQVNFEVADLLAQGRLSDPQPFCCTAETAFTRESVEIAKVADIHTSAYST